MSIGRALASALCTHGRSDRKASVLPLTHEVDGTIPIVYIVVTMTRDEYTHINEGSG